MLRLLAAWLAVLPILAMAGCGIESTYDIGQKLAAQTPLLPGTYKGESAEAKPAKITRDGDGYAMELTDDKGNVARARIRFFKIAEFDGYVLQFIDPDKPGKFLYLYTRVTPAGIEILDENIDNADLPPDLASRFDETKAAPGQTLFIKARTLKRGEDVMLVLQALARGKLPLTHMDYWKRQE
ncbi:MAG TPA: hypothetical protein VKX28_16790 [Xanthobacteraceae bacterium]|nr:hypothetical protein [Xanthobacteraceae bacterium]